MDELEGRESKNSFFSGSAIVSLPIVAHFFDFLLYLSFNKSFSQKNKKNNTQKKIMETITQ